MEYSASIKSEKGVRIVPLVLPVILIVAASLCASSSGLAEDPPPNAPPPISPGMEGAPSTIPPGETVSPPETGDVHERGVRDHRTQPGTFMPSQPTPTPPSAGGVPQQMLPVTPLTPALSTLGPRYVGPTDSITKVANAITWYHKSLTTLITVKPGLALTQPVTISVAYLSPAGYGPGSPERLTQVYAVTGNRFLRVDPEGNGQPRRVHLDITLTESKQGGTYNYNVPVDMDVEPLYDVVISPLQFSLLSTCNIVGDTEIDFYWYSPDTQKRKYTFHTVGGGQVNIGLFGWTHTEVGASANLHPQNFFFSTVNSVDFWELSGHFAPIIGPATSNIVPGKTNMAKGNMTAHNDNGCNAYFQYTTNYTLRPLYADLDSPMVRDHR